MVSRSGDVRMLSAVGLGDMILKAFGIAFYYGLNSSIETLVSQAVGAGNLRMAGVYLNTGRLLIFLFSFPICAIFLQTEKLLLVLDQDPLVCRSTYVYVLTNVPGLLFFAFYDLQRRFLVQFGLSRIPMTLQFISFFVCSGLMYVTIVKLQLGLPGCGLAMSVSNLLLLVLIQLKSHRQAVLWKPNMVSLWKRETITNIPLYLSYGLPNVLIIMSDWLCFQAMALVSGFFGVQHQAVQILLFNFSNIVF